MATDKQLSFIGKLLRQRDTSTLGVIDYGRDMSIGDASELIGKLVNCPFKTPTHAIEDGMYQDPNSGTIWKVQYNKATGDGRHLYAKRLHVEQIAENEWHCHFAYEGGAIRDIKPEWRMTLEQAKTFGALYGVCCVCGRTLTDEVSIEEGIGPICGGRLAR